MFFFGGFELLLPVVLLGLIVLGILALAGRGETDPTGRRSFAVYLFAVAFVSLFVALIALTGLVSSVVRIALPEHAGPDCVQFQGGVSCASRFPVTRPVPAGETAVYAPTQPFQRFDPDRQHKAQAVQTGLVAIAAILVLWFHAKRARELIGEPGFDEGPGRRVYLVYLYAVSFLAILIVLFAGSTAAYGLFRIIAPGTTGFLGDTSIERDNGVAQLGTGGLLALGAFVIFAFHWRRAKTFRGGSAAEPATVEPE